MKKVYIAMLVGLMLMTIITGCDAKGIDVSGPDVKEEVLDLDSDSSKDSYEEEMQGSDQEEIRNHTVNQEVSEMDDRNKEIQENTNTIINDIENVIDTLKDNE